MIPPIDAGTRLVALLGDPVRHSLSPLIQNAAFSHLGLPGVYLALRTDAAMLPHLLRGIAAAGGAGNVTVPHKSAAVAALDRWTPAVERTGACNTFWAADGVVWGDNTDVAGFRAALAELRQESAAGAEVLLVGAGGAARAVLAGLEEEEGPARVTILNRSPDRAAALVAGFPDTPLEIEIAPDGDAPRGARFDLVVNATSLGLHAADPFPIDPRLVETAAALDLVYGPRETLWVRAMRAAGVAAVDGTAMLVHQGAAAFERWWGRAAPIEIMRDALREHR